MHASCPKLFYRPWGWRFSWLKVIDSTMHLGPVSSKHLQRIFFLQTSYKLLKSNILFHQLSKAAKLLLFVLNLWWIFWRRTWHFRLKLCTFWYFNIMLISLYKIQISLFINILNILWEIQISVWNIDISIWNTCSNISNTDICIKIRDIYISDLSLFNIRISLCNFNGNIVVF